MDLPAINAFLNNCILVVAAIFIFFMFIKFYRGLTPFYKTMVGGLVVIFAMNIFLLFYAIGPLPGSPAEQFFSGF